MGVKVLWRDTKGVYSSLVSLFQFIGALCKFICSQLGEEHRDRLCLAGNAKAFIRESKATKEMYDTKQDRHPKTLIVCFIQVLATSTSKLNPESSFRNMMERVMNSRPARSQLHLKILAYHSDSLREGEELPLLLLDLTWKMVLMPRQ
jgi:hypothetical protein